jgi:hypothetical protein
MKYILVVIMACFTLSSLKAQDCAKVKDGKFTTTDEHSGTTLITRKGSKQIEENKELGFKAEFKIEWLSDCVYTIQMTKVIRKGKISFPIDMEMIMTVKIESVETDHYTVKVKSNKFDEVLETRVMIVQ